MSYFDILEERLGRGGYRDIDGDHSIVRVDFMQFNKYSIVPIRFTFDKNEIVY